MIVADGREYACAGWCMNTDALGSPERLESLLRVVCQRVGMRELATCSVVVETALSKRGMIPFEDEGGASAVLVLSTSHIAIHGWPHRDDSRPDGGWFRFGLSSCRGFDPGAVEFVLKAELGVTRLARLVDVEVMAELP